MTSAESKGLETRILEAPLNIQVGAIVAGDVPDGFYKGTIYDGSRYIGHEIEIPEGTEIWTNEDDLENLQLPMQEHNLLCPFSILLVKHEGSIYRVAKVQCGEGISQRGNQYIQSQWERISGEKLARFRRDKVRFPASWFPADTGGSIHEWKNWKWPDGSTLNYS